MKEFFHVSSLLVGSKPIIKRYNKPLQEYVDFCSMIHCSSYGEYVNGIEIINNKYENKIGDTGRDVYKWMAESFFETIRKEQYPMLPSRMNGIFLCDCFEDACTFRNKFRNENSKIYRCLLPEDEVYSFNMDLFTSVNETLKENHLNRNDEKVFKEQYEVVRRYWNECGYSGIEKEYLYEGDQVQMELVNE